MADPFHSPARSPLERAPTCIAGLDILLSGGLPRGRTTLLAGGPGGGKTLLALEALARSAQTFGEPGLFVALEEPPDRILANAASFGWGLPELVATGKLVILDAQLPRSVMRDGAFDLGGLIAALESARASTGATRVVFDGIDMLLDTLDAEAAVRRELFRVHDFIATAGLTGILTTKSTDEALASRYAFAEFMADCVIALAHRLRGRVATRSLRVRKYRGADHRADEIPFVITPTGLSVASAMSAPLEHHASLEKVTTGVERLDAMIGGGYFRGASVLISGAPGAAKSTLAGAFAESAARRGERTLFISFDEAPAQIRRNLTSVGIDLTSHVEAGVLVMRSMRGRSLSGDELVESVLRAVDELGANALVIDPISALGEGGADIANEPALRLIDGAKARGVTVVSTSLLEGADALAESTSMGISTISDTWMHLSYVARAGERNRALTVVKSRGVRHSNQVRELLLSDAGITLADVYTAGGEVLLGTQRWQREADERAAALAAERAAEQERVRTALQVKTLEAQAGLLQLQLEAQRLEAARLEDDAREDERIRRGKRSHLSRLRHADEVGESGPAPREAGDSHDPAGRRGQA